MSVCALRSRRRVGERSSGVRTSFMSTPFVHKTLHVWFVFISSCVCAGKGGREGGRESPSVSTRVPRRDARPRQIGAAQRALSCTHLIPRVLNQLARKVLAQIFSRLLDPLDRLCGAARKGETRVRATPQDGGGASGAVTAPTQRGEGAPTRHRSTHSAEGEAIVLVAEVRLWRRQLVHFQLDLRGTGAGGSAGA